MSFVRWRLLKSESGWAKAVAVRERRSQRHVGLRPPMVEASERDLVLVLVSRWIDCVISTGVADKI